MLKLGFDSSTFHKCIGGHKFCSGLQLGWVHPSRLMPLPKTDLLMSMRSQIMPTKDSLRIEIQISPWSSPNLEGVEGHDTHANSIIVFKRLSMSSSSSSAHSAAAFGFSMPSFLFGFGLC
ncbi:uncharacterized protein LOC128196762 isoform X2 [Vigna angularis]|uniref:uncharacterized protein LOC128196762 isoform X2 n=1 Tax=Phaseolus angularis TaxID=3914 RepID=UPI0022B3D0FA|nr:uncharacterized protein LOC128196762 isoform X2 [Vigna angularis]